MTVKHILDKQGWPLCGVTRWDADSEDGEPCSKCLRRDLADIPTGVFVAELIRRGEITEQEARRLRDLFAGGA